MPELTLNDVMEAIYPIGSYYINETDPTDPAILLDFGTWEAVTDRFIVARGSIFNGIGGSITHAHALSDAAYAQAQAFEAGGNSFLDARYVTGSGFTSNHRVSSPGGTPPSVAHSGGIPLRGNTNASDNIPPYQAAYVWKRVLDGGFTKYASNPVMAGNAAWEAGVLCEPSVMLENGTFKMWYRGNSDAGSKIAYATSSDGINWTKHSGNPILTVSGGVAYPVVIKIGSTYHLYAGKISDGNLYRWSSSDGINWTADNGGAPVLDLADTVCNVSVYYDASDTPKYRMLFEVFTGSNFQLRYAHSSDGLSWTVDSTNPVYPHNAGNPSEVFKIGDTFYCFTGDCSSGGWKIELIKSKNWTSWSKVATKSIPIQGWEGADISDPCLLLNVSGKDHQCYMWYIGNQTDMGMAYLDMPIEDYVV